MMLFTSDLPSRHCISFFHGLIRSCSQLLADLGGQRLYLPINFKETLVASACS